MGTNHAVNSFTNLPHREFQDQADSFPMGLVVLFLDVLEQLLRLGFVTRLVIVDVIGNF